MQLPKNCSMNHEKKYQYCKGKVHNTSWFSGFIIKQLPAAAKTTADTSRTNNGVSAIILSLSGEKKVILYISDIVSVVILYVIISVNTQAFVG